MGLGVSRRAGWQGRLLKAVIAFLAAVFGLLGWRHFWPVVEDGGWHYRVLADDLPSVSALAADDQGGLYASLELRHGKGSIVQLGADGSRRTVKDDLFKPDGMIRYRGGIAYSQEEGDNPVRWWQGERDEPLFVGHDVEGLATDGHYLYGIEDKPKDARLLRFDPDSAEVVALRGGLDEAEGVAVCPDGRMLYLEKKKAWVKQLNADGRDEVVAAGLNAPGFLLCDRAGLWITEDATHMARLLLLDGAGRLQVILSHLRSAQTILPVGEGRYLVAEQGRNRILEITR